jgi:hypothetical protein
MTAEAEDNYEEHVWLEHEDYVPTMAEVGEAVCILNAAYRYLGGYLVAFAPDQGRRVCPWVSSHKARVPFLAENWVEMILNAGDMLNAAIKANPTMTAEWEGDEPELKISFT